MNQKELNKVRTVLSNHVGSRVRVRSNRGRHKIEVSEGVISEIYPSIFLIQVDDGLEDTMHTVSYSYADVLTKDVQLMLCS
ncbi:MAG: Veg family protein [Clostridiales bacterium]|nr:Veg family protein [Clostridiales bacterium]